MYAPRHHIVLWLATNRVQVQLCDNEGGLALNAIDESRVLRPAGFLTESSRVLIAFLVILLGGPALLSAQMLHYAKPPDAKNGEKIYKGGCIACHGSDGTGAPETSTVFLRKKDTFPDFTDCSGTT